MDRMHMACMQQLNHVYPDIATVGVPDCPYIDQAKSIIATRHMDDSDVVVIIDHDMIFEPEAVMMIATAAHEKQAVVGAAYSARGGTGQQIAFIDPPVTFFEGGGLVEVTAMAGGFIAIPVSVLERLVERNDMETAQTVMDFMAYPFFHCIVMNQKWWGEDLSFCLRCRDAGIGLYIDTRPRIGHKGSYVYMLEDALIKVPTLKTMSISKSGMLEEES
jgi:hypothetical protein